MTPYPVLNFIIWALVVVFVIVIFVFVLRFVIDALDDETAAAAVSAGLGWCKNCKGTGY